MRTRFAILGALIAAITDIALNLLAAAIQNRALADHFTLGVIGWLVVVIVLGVLLGLWLGGSVTLPVPIENNERMKGQPHQQQVITRLFALLSYGKLRGKGIKLSDILLIGSVLDIDMRE